VFGAAKLQINIKGELKMNKGVKELIILVVAAVVIGVGANYIRANKNTVAVQAVAAVDNSTGIGKIIGIKGVNDLTGITTMTDLNNEYTIKYTYNADFNNSIIDEIGYALSDRIRQVYNKYPDTDKLNFIVNIEYPSQGILVNKPYVQFTTTKATFTKINWETYKYSQLLDIATNVKSLATGIMVSDNLRLKETTNYTIPKIKKDIKKDAMNTQKLGQD